MASGGRPENQPLREKDDETDTDDYDSDRSSQTASAPAWTPSGQTFADTTASTTQWPKYFSPGTRRSPSNTPDRDETMASISEIGFRLKPFSGTARDDEKADRWLHSFNTYTKFKKIEGEAKLNLLKLMMVDQAEAWLMALPDGSRNTMAAIETAFMHRYGLTEPEKWRQTKDIWCKEQGENESVDDYVTAMHITATRVGMPNDTLKEAIIQGLKPELRLFVLANKVGDIPELLKLARTCEAARSADKSGTNNVDKLTAKVDDLMKKIDSMVTRDDDKGSTRRVSFTQAAVDEAIRTTNEFDRSGYRRSMSPGEGRRTGSPQDYRRYPTSFDRSANTTRNNDEQRRPVTPTNDGRGTGRFEQTWQQPSRWSTTTNGSTWRRPSEWSTTSSGPTRQTTTSTYNNSNARPARPWQSRTQQSSTNCGFCGRQHQFGRSFCPAASLQCFNCSRTGHMARMCRNSARTQNVMSPNSH